MPLYTYVVTYRGESFTTQARRSNPKGFLDWLEALPPTLRKLVTDPYRGSFEAVPNQQNVWRNKFRVDGNDLNVVIVQTDD